MPQMKDPSTGKWVRDVFGFGAEEGVYKASHPELYNAFMKRLQTLTEEDIIGLLKMADYYDMGDYSSTSPEHEEVLRRAQARYSRSPVNTLGDNVLDQLTPYNKPENLGEWEEAMNDAGVRPFPYSVGRGPFQSDAVWDASQAANAAVVNPPNMRTQTGGNIPRKSRMLGAAPPTAFVDTFNELGGQGTYAGIPDMTVLEEVTGGGRHEPYRGVTQGQRDFGPGEYPLPISDAAGIAAIGDNVLPDSYEEYGVKFPERGPVGRETETQWKDWSEVKRFIVNNAQSEEKIENMIKLYGLETVEYALAN